MRREFALIRNFMQLYDLKQANHTLKRDAYEATEQVWLNETGKRFYKSYTSFAASRTHYFKARKLFFVSSVRIAR